MLLCAMIFAMGTLTTAKADPVFTGNGVFERITTDAQMSEGWFVIANSGPGQTAEFAMTSTAGTFTGPVGFNRMPLTGNLELGDDNLVNPSNNVVWHFQQVENNIFTIQAFTNDQYLNWVTVNDVNLIADPTGRNAEWTVSWHETSNSFEVRHAVETRFLAHRPQVGGINPIPRFALNANHTAPLENQRLQLFRWNPELTSTAVSGAVAFNAADFTVDAGEVFENMNANITITLGSDVEFLSTYNFANTNITDWVSPLPVGLVVAVTSTGNNVATINITGRPIEAGSFNMMISAPKRAINENVVGAVTLTNHEISMEIEEIATRHFVRVAPNTAIQPGYFMITAYSAHAENLGRFAMNNLSGDNAVAGSAAFVDGVALNHVSNFIENPNINTVWRIDNVSGNVFTIREASALGERRFYGRQGTAFDVTLNTEEDVSVTRNHWTQTWVGDLVQFVNTRYLRFRSDNTTSPRFNNTAAGTAASLNLILYRLDLDFEPPSTEAPAFSVAEGIIFEPSINLSITNHTMNPDADIFFTLDGTEPDENSTPFVDPIVINTTTTVRAIARHNNENSEIVSATFTFPVNVGTVAEFLAAGTPGAANETIVRITGDLTFVYRPSAAYTAAGRNHIFLRDETGGLMVLTGTGAASPVFEFPSTFNPGDVISGIIGTRDIFNGQLRFRPTEGQPTVTSVPGTPVEPIVLTAGYLLENLQTYNAQLIKLVGVNFATATDWFNTNVVASRSISQGDTSGLAVRSHFAGVIKPDIVVGAYYDVSGFLWHVTNRTPNHEIFLRRTDDNFYNITLTPIITVNHLSHAFGATVEIGNTATFDFDVETVGIPDEVTVTLSNTAVFSYAWNAGRDVLTVTFAPATTDPINATLTLSGAGAQSNTEVVITLTGTGREPGAPSLEFADDTELTFAALAPGDPSAAQTADVNAEDLDGSTITFHFAGGNDSYFSAVEVGNNFATGQDGQLSITFAPLTAGTHRDTLVISVTVNTTTVYDSLPLVGTGVAVIGGAPTAEAATDVTATGFTANWTAVANATSYQVRVYQGPTATGTPVRTPTVDYPATSLEITGLPDGTQFTFTVIARGDLDQVSEASNPIQVTTETAIAPIARWMFAGIVAADNFGASPFAPEARNLNVTVGGLTRHWTLASGTAAGNAWGGNNFTNTTNIDEAITANNFVTFTLTANADHALSISEIGNYNVRRTNPGPSTGQWQFQVGTGEFVNIGTPITWGAAPSTAANGIPQDAIDLSGIAALQNVAAGTAVTFRLVLWGGTTQTAVWYFNDGGNSGAPGLRIYGELVSTALVATPVFSEPEGNMFATANVTITVPGGGAEIFYSKDPTAPREEFNALPSSGYVTITETTTLRAFARIDTDESVMAQAIYTFPVDVATIAEFLALGTPGTANATMVRITGDLTFVWRPETGQTGLRNFFVKDETGGLLVFDNVMPFTFMDNYEPGDLITGGLIGTRDVNNGQVRFITTPHQPELPAAGTPSPLSIEPVDVTMEYLLDNIVEMNARLVRLTNINFNANHTFAPNAATNAVFSQDGNSMTARSHFQGVDVTVDADLQYDIVGFVWRHVAGNPPTTTHQIVLRNTDDIIGRPTIIVDTETIAFGNQEIGTTSDAQTITVTGINLQLPIAIIDAALAPNFTATEAQDWELYYGGTITITFAPTTAGPKRAVLYFYSDDQRKDSVVLTGTGVDPTSICPRDIEENTVVLFPNPVVDVLNIVAEQTIATVRIYNLAGQLVVHGNRNYVDMSTLPRGTYVVRIVFENGAVVTRTVVK